MKVLKNGIFGPPEAWRAEVSCKDCGAVLRVNVNDLYGLESVHYTWTYCPQCRTRLNVESPKQIWRESIWRMKERGRNQFHC